MPTHKESLRRLSLSQLAALTGKAHKTVVDRVRGAGVKPVDQDGRTTYFDPHQALPAIYDAEDAQAARARFDNARAERAEFELKIKASEYVPAADQAQVVIGLATVVSHRVQAIGAACAQELAVETTADGCKRIIDRETRAALEDLASAGDAAVRRRGREQ